MKYARSAIYLVVLIACRFARAFEGWHGSQSKESQLAKDLFVGNLKIRL
jgi:hypothetical protein